MGKDGLKKGNIVYANNVNENRLDFYRIKDKRDIDNSWWFWNVDINEGVLIKFFKRDESLKRYFLDDVSFFDDGNFCIGKHIFERPEYLHHLQNFYKRHTKKELTLNL